MGALAGFVVGVGAYSATHRGRFDGWEAARWGALGALAGGTLGLGVEAAGAYGLLGVGSVEAGGAAFAGAEGIQVASGGGRDIRAATFVRQIARGEHWADVLEELKASTYETGFEYGVVRLQDETRWVVSGGTEGFRIEGVKRLIIHTHPYEFMEGFVRSDDDVRALQALGQGMSYIAWRGQIFRFWSNK